MAFPIFPSSPLPGNIQRRKKWNGNQAHYDSGAFQGFTAWTQPRFEWSVPWKNVSDAKQSTLASFVDSVRGTTDLFLIKDPYDYVINSVTLVTTNFTQGNTLQTFDARSFHVRIDTSDISTLTSALSGFVTLGTEFTYDQDNGIMLVNTIDATDHWSVNSVEFFRKAHFKVDYSDVSPLWNQFNVNMIIEEVA